MALKCTKQARSIFTTFCRTQNTHHRGPRHVRGHRQHGQPQLRHLLHGTAPHQGRVVAQRHRDFIPGPEGRGIGKSKYYTIAK